MKELPPNEFQDILDENGEIAPSNLSMEEKGKLSLALMLQHAKSSAGMRCFACKGTCFFPPNSNFTCTACNGRGWK